jgi:hypothetical protein
MPEGCAGGKLSVTWVRPTQGIVTVATRGINQDDIEVISFERTMLIYRRGHSPADDDFHVKTLGRIRLGNSHL